MNIFDRRYEMMPRAQLEQLQLERLQALLARLKRNVRRAREKIGDTRVESLADLSRLPFTTPEEMAESFPYGMFAFPMREIIRLHTTVGPQGKPLVIGHTRNDLAQWGRLVARQLVGGGVTANDVVQMCFSGGVYGAAGYLFGAQVIEASVIAEDSAHVDYQIATLQNYRPTVLITTPGNALDLMQVMEQRGLDPQSLHVRTVLLSRPVNKETRERLTAGLFARVLCNFGISEILDPGLCLECSAGNFHVHEDHFFPEIQDGELVLTTLCREAVPLLRYRTRVECELTRDKCSCGRTGAIIVPGERLDQRLRVKETQFYQSQIADVLARTKAAGQPFTVAVSDRRIVVSIELSETLFADTVWVVESLKREIESDFLARLNVEAEIHWVNPRSNAVPETYMEDVSPPISESSSPAIEP
jgi:phenylacetate-CoA ligase